MKKIIIAAPILILLALAFIYFLQTETSPSAPKVTIIGVIRTPPALDPAWEGFRKKMGEFGYREGENTKYIVKEAGKDLVETKKAVVELLDVGVNLIYVMGVLPARAAKEVTAERAPDLPIIFGVVSDPVGGKLVEKLSSSGNNLSGVTPANEIVSPKRLELFKEMLPKIRRVIVVWGDPKTTGIEEMRSVAKIFGITLVEKEVKIPEEIDAFLDPFSFQSGDAIFRATDNVNAARAQKIIALALNKKIPLSGTNASDSENGVLMSYGANYEKIGGQAARLAHQVLTGKKPSDLPIEFPEEFELIVNLKTAEKIGVKISDDFLAKTNRVIR